MLVAGMSLPEGTRDGGGGRLVVAGGSSSGGGGERYPVAN